MTSPIRFRFLSPRFAGMFGLSLILQAFAWAADGPKQAFDLPADTAENSIKRFSEQTNLEVLYASEVTQGVRTAAVKGEMTPREALDAMLAGTGLTVVQDEQTKAFSVRRENARPNVPGVAPTVTEGGRPDQKAQMGNETIVLNPFEVKTDKDTSYGALNSNSITRFNTALDKVPVSADIFTTQFMQDVDVTTVNDLLTQYGAGIGVVLTNPSGAGFSLPGDAPSVVQIGVRGLGAGAILRNGFNINPENGANAGGNPWQNSFDVERVEVLRGPEGLLYGASGAGGTIVSTTKEAKFDQMTGSVSERIDQFGSKRTVVDANDGNSWMAARFVFLNEDDQYMREFLFTKDRGYYGELAFRLPLRTTLKINAEYLVDDRNTSDSSITVNLGSGDPRNGDNLQALYFNNDTGAINPATGQPWSGIGAIDGGLVSWQNISSFLGWRSESLTDNLTVEAAADTVWTSWLSTEVAVNYNDEQNTINQTTSALFAPLVSGNPLNAWAVNTNMNDANNFNRYKQLRVAATVSKDFFGGTINTQTATGFDKEQQGFGTQAMSYYLSDSNGNLITSPTITTNLGRTPAGSQWWSVNNGPVFHPAYLPPMATPLWYSAQDGKYYVRQERDPRSPSWVTPINPEGLGQLFFPASAGVSGNDLPDYENQYGITGAYLVNSTSWFGDLFNTLVGYRRTETKNDVPNVSSLTASAPFNTAARISNSYNLGVDGRITSWLRWYVSASANYNNPLNTTPPGGDDPYGNLPVNSRGMGQEVGFKFTPMNSLISGSLAYYQDQSKDDTWNQSVSLANINPVGLNGQYQGAFGAGAAIPVDYTSKGVELIMTANPTRNWRIRLAVTTQDGTVKSNKSYGILYNDQFYTDGKGDVTYKDGTPFLVPVTPGTNVSSLSTATNPVAILASGPTQQLTTAMMGNSSSPYYAWEGNQVSVAGNVAPTSYVGKALEYFNQPNVGTALTGVTGLPISQIQYAWTDPNQTGGKIVVTQAGEDTVGYPVWRISLTNAYEFSEGWLKGVGAVLSLNNSWQFRTFYYATPGTTALQLWSEPELGWQINLNPYYTHKFGKIVWRTQLNIANLTNHYVLVQPPNNGSGFTKPLTLGVRWEGQPRSWAWSNSFSY